MAGQVGQVIWQNTNSSDSTDMVTVRPEALLVILPVVDTGLTHGDVEALADLEEANEHLQGALAGGAPDSE